MERMACFSRRPTTPEIASAVDRVVARGIPVVTLVTDVPNCRRAAYVGMDNRAAGETAAYLIGEWLSGAKAKILATLSSNRFRGEEEREIGFRRAIRTRYPNLGIVEIERRSWHRPAHGRARAQGARRQSRHRRRLFDRRRKSGRRRGVPRDRAKVSSVRRPRSRRRQSCASSRVRDFGRAPSRPARRHALGLSRRDAGASRVAAKRPAGAVPGSDHHPVQPAGGMRQHRHREERSDVAIQRTWTPYVPWIASLRSQ